MKVPISTIRYATMSTDMPVAAMFVYNGTSSVRISGYRARKVRWKRNPGMMQRSAPITAAPTASRRVSIPRAENRMTGTMKRLYIAYLKPLTSHPGSAVATANCAAIPLPSRLHASTR